MFSPLEGCIFNISHYGSSERLWAVTPMKILVIIFKDKLRPCFRNFLFLVLSAGDKVIKAKSLWEANGAVVVAVRRPGWFLCREVMETECRNWNCRRVLLSLMVSSLIPSLSVGGLWAVLSETSAGRARGPSVCCGEGKHRHRDPGLQTALRWGHLHRWRGEQIPPVGLTYRANKAV